MARKISNKRKDAFINAAYGQYCSGIQVPVLKIGAIWKAGEKAYDESGGNFAAVGTAMKEAAEQVALIKG